jgi:hypothetical protein
MHDHRKTAKRSQAEHRSTEKEDARMQAVVIALLLAEWPERLSQADAARELLGENPDFSERDAFERAVEDLTRIGLIAQEGGFIVPSRVVRHFDNLQLE